MNPDTVAELNALELQLTHLRRIQHRLRESGRIHPGTSTFWQGEAHRRYEEQVRRLDRALDATDTALVDAIDRTERALAAVRHVG